MQSFTPGRTVLPGSDSVPTTIAPDNAKSFHHDDGSAITFSQSALYNVEERDPKKDEVNRQKALKEYVRQNLFPGWKFFTSAKQLHFNNNSGSIVVKICNDLNVSPKSRQTWWELNKGVILENLNRKRSDVAAYLKKQFIGKLQKPCKIELNIILSIETNLLCSFGWCWRVVVKGKPMLGCYICCRITMARLTLNNLNMC
jgi:hypothetical protein